MTTIEFNVFISNPKKQVLIPITSRGGMFHNIEDWYKMATLDVANFLHVAILDITFNRDTNKMAISYVRLADCDESPDTIHYMLADPDDSGNNPLTIGDTSFLVIGET
jgi:hypothetical protein